MSRRAGSVRIYFSDLTIAFWFYDLCRMRWSEQFSVQSLMISNLGTGDGGIQPNANDRGRNLRLSTRDSFGHDGRLWPGQSHAVGNEVSTVA